MKTILIIATSTLLFAGCATNYNNTPTKTTEMHKTMSKAVNFLTDNNGMALYTFDKDSKNRSNCYGGCEKKWPVFYGNTSKLNLPNGINTNDFGTIKRDDGKMQTTYKSKPLYYFFMDTKAGETKGDGKKGVWHLIRR